MRTKTGASLMLATALGFAAVALPAAAGLVPPTGAGSASAAQDRSLAGSLVSALPRETLTAHVLRLGGFPTFEGAGSSAAAIDGNIVVGGASYAKYSAHAWFADLGTAAPTMRDLGTLGGPDSSATAVDEHVVVGRSMTRIGSDHAFAYDLDAANPTMRDLGALSTWSSYATAVDGNIVVGTSMLSGASYHAFAFDLADPSATMRDLGTLGGNSSGATAVDGNRVVGFSSTATGDIHPFVLDLADPSATMRDLGTLGGTRGVANDVSGNLVVGGATTSSGAEHAFVYDLAAGAPTMRDLGSLRGGSSDALGVEGNTVLGLSGHPFVYDLAADAPTMRDLGSLGGKETGEALDGFVVSADRDIVVGGVNRAGDDKRRAFAYDLGAPTPQLVDLPTPDPRSTSQAVDVEGTHVVGNIDGSAVVWTLARTRAPALRFSTFRYTVREDRPRVTLSVVRAGDPTRAVQVRYATRAITTVAGKDFRSVSGTLRLAAGQTRTTFSVPILDDARREKPETVMATLSAPSSGAVLGTPNTASLVIAASDQRPDALISTRLTSGYVGNNIYNTTGRHQTRTLAARRTQTRTFWVKVVNDGNATDTLVLRGSVAKAGSTVRYFDGTTNITGTLRSTRGLHVSRDPGQYTLIRVELTPRTTAAIGSRKSAVVTGTWRGDVTRTDVARAVVTVIR